MLVLALRMAGRRVAALIAVALAVLGGTALVTTTGVLAESGLRSHVPPGRLAGADLVVAAPQSLAPPGELGLSTVTLPERATMPADLVDALATVPGVTAAVGDVSFPAAVVDARGRVIPGVENPSDAGHGWSSTVLLDSARVKGSAPAGPGEVALGTDLAVAAGADLGDRVTVVVAGRSGTYRVSAHIDSPDASLYVDDTTALALAARTYGVRADTVDLVGLRVASGRESAVHAAVQEHLRNAPGGLTVLARGDLGNAVAPGSGAARSVLLLIAGSLAGVTLLVVGFAVAGALTVWIAGRRRELALLRAIGATPQQVRRLAAAEASAIAAVAAAPGAALGYPVAQQFRELLVDGGLLPAALPLSVSPLPALLALLLLGAVVQIAARAAAWRTSRMPAVEAVAESASEARTPSATRARVGLLLIAAATTLSVAPLLAPSPVGAAGTSMAGILAAIGLALSGPALVGPAAGQLARLLPRDVSAPRWLAVTGIQGHPLRIAGTVASLAMAVVFALTYVLAQTTVISATARQVDDGTLAQLSISAPQFGGLPVGLIEDVRTTPGVRSAAPVSTTTVVWSQRLFGEQEISAASAMVLTPEAPELIDLDVREGSLDGLSGSTIALGEDAARARGAAVGEVVALALGDGVPVEARVVAIYARTLGFGPVVLSRDLTAGHSAALDQSILVRTDGSPQAQRGLTALTSAPGLVLRRVEEGTGIGQQTPPEVWVNLAVVTVLLAYLLLSIANRLVAATAQRRTDIATLRLVGTTPRQVLAVMRWETAIVCAGALVGALAVCAVPLGLLGVAFLGRPWPAGPLWLLPVIAATVVGLAFLTTEMPTRQALRTPPAAALARP
ncbi:FtsX-like permease family protein [Actinoplanes sp. CA-015351]|uniref:FtsX-like permease family protein n=1 Tax=Actinoplanes sp. CA-015351 TaxID=3239897 RepID=UPI003D959897